MVRPVILTIARCGTAPISSRGGRNVADTTRIETRYSRAAIGVLCIRTERRPGRLPLVIVGEYCQTEADALESVLALRSSYDARTGHRQQAEAAASAADTLQAIGNLIGATR